MVKWKRDLILSIVLILVSVVLFIYSGTFKTTAINIPAAMPDVYMRLWLGLMFVLSVLLLIRTLRKRPQDTSPKIWGKLQIYTVVAMFLYILLMKKIGFRICTGLFVWITTAVYCLSGPEGLPRGKPLVIALAKYLLFAVLVTAACDLLFRRVLSCNLPSFSLFR